jgi:hypothetical protein
VSCPYVLSSSLKEPEAESCLALYFEKRSPVGFFAARAVSGSKAAVTRERSFMVVVWWCPMA